MPQKPDNMAKEKMLEPLASGEDMTVNRRGILELERALAQMRFAATRAGRANGLKPSKYQFIYPSGGLATRPMAVLGTNPDGDVVAIAPLDDKWAGNMSSGYALKRITNGEIADGKYFFSDSLYSPFNIMQSGDKMVPLGAETVYPKKSMTMDRAGLRREEREYKTAKAKQSPES